MFFQKGVEIWYGPVELVKTVIIEDVMFYLAADIVRNS